VIHSNLSTKYFFFPEHHVLEICKLRNNEVPILEETQVEYGTHKQ